MTNIAIFDKTFVGPIANGIARIGRTGTETHPFSLQPCVGGQGDRYWRVMFECRCPCANRGGMDGANNKSHSRSLGKPERHSCKG